MYMPNIYCDFLNPHELTIIASPSFNKDTVLHFLQFAHGASLNVFAPTGI